MPDAFIHHLIVLLHRFKSFDPERKVRGECAALRQLTGQVFSNPSLVFLRNNIGFFTPGSIVPYINKWLHAIDKGYLQAQQEHPEKTIKIIFIGHSMGGLIARKLYVCACGNNPEAPLEAGIDADDRPRPWAAQVERLVLLAGMNNGWNIDYHNSIGRVLQLSIGLAMGNFLSYFHRKPILLTIRRGGSYITQLRLQTLAMLAKPYGKTVGDALTVQLLGSIDDLVSPQDDIDDVGGVSFVYREVPFSGHKSIIDLTDKTRIMVEGLNTTIGAERAMALTEALTQSKDVLAANSYNIPAFKNIDIYKEVTDVIFVVHGIRDEGFWTLKLGNRVLRKVQNLQLNPQHYAIETSSYGYFPLLQFALPGYRNGKVAWFMDRYAANKIRYPNAEFSFMGHSNGTFLIAKALSEYPACKFKHVIFAGSVITRSFDWQKYIGAKRVQKIYNIAATSDLVVGIFPQAMHALFRDLGAAGYRGFETLTEAQQTITIPGGHGAGVTEQYWEAIADFIVTGTFNQPIPKDPVARKFLVQPWLSGLLFIAAFALFFAVIPYSILHGVSNGELKIILLVIYIFVLWKFLTRF
ncbi:MAG: hypothetical protein ABIR15_15225 [Chitinophagaceae bacterium]